MHDWSDSSVDWKGIDDAARWIATQLVRYGRVNVRDYKEKWGTVRVYLSFGWHQFHSITHPRHCYSRYPKWLWHLDCKYGNLILRPISQPVLRYQTWLYRKVYQLAVKKWPHLEKEITRAADYRELLD